MCRKCTSEYSEIVFRSPFLWEMVLWSIMKVVDEFSYRNAKEILEKKHPEILKEIFEILNDPNNVIDLVSTGSQRRLSAPVQNWFVEKGWKKEQRTFSIEELRYDLLKNNIPIEIELGHQRLVYADFFEFMADYSKEYIPLGIMVVTGDPTKFGHTWHNSLESTTRKISAIKESFLVPILVIAVDP